MNRTFAVAAAVLLAAPLARATEETGKPAAAAANEDRPYIDAALAFCKAWTHVARKAPAGDEAWAELARHAGAKVAIKIDGKDLSLDVAGKKGDAQLVKFAKLGTWREGKDVKGVTIEVADFTIGGAAKSGKAKLAMTETGGNWTVDSIAVE